MPAFPFFHPIVACHWATSRLLGCLLALLLPALAHPQGSLPPLAGLPADVYIEKAMEQWRIPGLAIAVVKNDTVLYARGFGTTRANGGQSVTPRTLFPIWSMSKSFTALALALLEQQGRMALDSPVQRYDARFTLTDPQQAAQVSTLDLLSHRVGIETFQGDFLWSGSTLPADSLLAAFGKLPVPYQLRTGFHYSNLAYLQAGRLIELASGQPWQQFLRSQLLQPLGMQQAVTEVKELPLQQVAQGHTLQQALTVAVPPDSPLRIAPFGGMYAHVLDLANWLRVHLHKGRWQQQQLFSPATIDRVLQPYNVVGQIPLPDGSRPLTNYGLGWELRDYRHRTVYSHGGAYSGFVSMMAFVPAEQLGLVVLTNSDAHELCEALRWQIIDAFLQYPAANYSDGIRGYLQGAEASWQQAEKQMGDTAALRLPTALPLAAFAGSYQHPLYGKTQVSVQGDGTLQLRFQHHPALQATLQPLGGHRFWCRYSHPMFGNTVVPFQTSGGRVSGFELSVHPSVEFTTYWFQKE